MESNDFLNESNHKTESDKIVFHSYDELKEYCANPNNPLDKVVLGKEIDSLSRLFKFSDRTNEQFEGISDWDVSNVRYMSCMFAHTTSFNQPLNNWDVSKVKDMEGMFWNAKSFNQSLDDWDVSSVKDMTRMFDSSKLVIMDNLPNWYEEINI